MKISFAPLLIALLLTGLLSGQRVATASPALEAKTLNVDGKEREYLVYVPKKVKGLKNKTVPLVLMLHGRGSNNRQAASSHYGWVNKADEKAFIAVFPNAEGSPKSWEPAWGVSSTSDTVFLDQLIDQLLKDYAIDSQRVFLTGHSSGGIMSFSFAATNSDKVAAIGPVAGSIGWGRRTIPKPKGPVSVISFHGIADRIVPYDKEHGKSAAYAALVGAPESVNFWVKHNACAETPKTSELRDGKVSVQTWTSEKPLTRVVLHSIEGGTHDWPNKRQSVDATSLIWEFFEKTTKADAAAAAPSEPIKK